MKNLLMICVLGFSLFLGACAHKHGNCADGSCSMETSGKKECGCKHDHKPEAEATKK